MIRRRKTEYQFNGLESDTGSSLRDVKSMKKGKTRVLLANDHPLVVEGLRSYLRRYNEIHVIGQAKNGKSTLRTARRLRPDVILLDVNLPDISGFEVLRKLQAELPETKVLMYAAHKDSDTVLESLQQGAAGYISKDSSPEKVVRAIEQVRSTEKFLLAIKGLRSFRPGTPAGAAKRAKRLSVTFLGPRADLFLTSREKEILALMLEGLKTSEIARLTDLRYYTVTSHFKNIFRKLRVHSRSEAAAVVLNEMAR